MDSRREINVRRRDNSNSTMASTTTSKPAFAHTVTHSETNQGSTSGTKQETSSTMESTVSSLPAPAIAILQSENSTLAKVEPLVKTNGKDRHLAELLFGGSAADDTAGSSDAELDGQTIGLNTGPRIPGSKNDTHNGSSSRSTSLGATANGPIVATFESQPERTIRTIKLNRTVQPSKDVTGQERESNKKKERDTQVEHDRVRETERGLGREKIASTEQEREREKDRPGVQKNYHEQNIHQHHHQQQPQQPHQQHRHQHRPHPDISVRNDRESTVESQANKDSGARGSTKGVISSEQSTTQIQQRPQQQQQQQRQQQSTVAGSVGDTGNNQGRPDPYSLLSITGKVGVLDPKKSFFGHSRFVDEFEKINKVGEGTYGVVYRAKDRMTNEVVALKRIRMERENDGLPISSLREIKLLKTLRHENVVLVKDVAVGNDLDQIFLVMEYCEQDMGTLMDNVKKPYTPSEVKCLMYQLLKGIEYCHDHYVVHRDLKLSNLLLNSQGILKIADFGLARSFGMPSRPMTPKVVTLWYRAPELLFGDLNYTTAIDMWSTGCIFGELLKHRPLLPGAVEKQQVELIIQLLGTPHEKIWPGFKDLPMAGTKVTQQWQNNLRNQFSGVTDATLSLLNGLLTYDPKKRLTVKQALAHPYFIESPPAKHPSLLPTHPDIRHQISGGKIQGGGANDGGRGNNNGSLGHQGKSNYNHHNNNSNKNNNNHSNNLRKENLSNTRLGNQQQQPNKDDSRLKRSGPQSGYDRSSTSGNKRQAR